MHLIDDAAIGASLEDIANWMMSGTPNEIVDTLPKLSSYC